MLSSSAGGLRALFRSRPTLVSRFLVHSTRDISVSSVFQLKKIERIEEGNKIIIEGKHIPSPREQYLVKETALSDPSASPAEACACSLCKLDLQIKHTDVLILCQYVDSRGKRLPRKVTGLCKEQDKRIDYLLVMAEKAGLMDRYNDAEKINLVGWESFNKYYDDAVVEEFIHGRRRKH